MIPAKKNRTAYKYSQKGCGYVGSVEQNMCLEEIGVLQEIVVLQVEIMFQMLKGNPFCCEMPLKDAINKQKMVNAIDENDGTGILRWSRG